MSKRRYLVGFNISNKLAKKRIMNDPYLANLISGDKDGKEIVIIKGGLKAKEVVDMAFFLSSALTVTCCHMDNGNVPDNKDFYEELRSCIYDLICYAEEFDNMLYPNAKGFKTWFLYRIETCESDYCLQGYKNFDENLVKVYPVDIEKLNEVSMFISYDNVKENEGEVNE